MCPLVAQPNRGYPDYQRVGNYDEQPLIGGVVGPQTTPYNSAIFDVSRFAYLGGRITPNTNAASFQITWYADSLGSTVIAWRTFQISPNIAQNASLRLPNLGPFVQIQINPIGGLTFTFTLVLFGTNRVHPLEFIPQNPTLIQATATALGSPGSATAWPNDYYAGPVQVWVDTAAQPIGFGIQMPDTTGTMRQVSQLVQAANSNQVYTLVTPPGAWAFNVSNQGGAATSVTYAIQHTTTGAM